MDYLTRGEFADAIDVCYNTLVNWLRWGWIIPVFTIREITADRY